MPLFAGQLTSLLDEPPVRLRQELKCAEFANWFCAAENIDNVNTECNANTWEYVHRRVVRQQEWAELHGLLFPLPPLRSSGLDLSIADMFHLVSDDASRMMRDISRIFPPPSFYSCERPTPFLGIRDYDLAMARDTCRKSSRLPNPPAPYALPHRLFSKLRRCDERHKRARK